MKCLEKKHHVAIDETLKQGSSTVNDLSEYSCKARKKGIREISVLYAYDIEKREPICSKVFPGNMIDATSYDTFIKENGIESGFLVDGKGFPPSRIKEVLAANRALGFLTPLKRNAKAIAENSMYVFDSVTETALGNIQCKKCTLKKDLFLYSFREGWMASIRMTSGKRVRPSVQSSSNRTATRISKPPMTVMTRDGLSSLSSATIRIHSTWIGPENRTMVP